MIANSHRNSGHLGTAIISDTPNLNLQLVGEGQAACILFGWACKD